MVLPDNVSAKRDDVLHHSGNVQPYSDLCAQEKHLIGHRSNTRQTRVWWGDAEVGLTLETMVMKACAMGKGRVSGAPNSKQSFIRERPCFPQNIHTYRSRCRGTSTSWNTHTHTRDSTSSTAWSCFKMGFNQIIKTVLFK